MKAAYDAGMRSTVLLLMPLFLLACGDKDGGDSSEATDADEDGFFAELDDCDDSDPNIHPGAEEVCNGADDNCDGTVDEGALELLFVDADQDGYGDPSSSIEGCDGATGVSSNDQDCDDSDASVNPAAIEVCGGSDEDCDALVDDDDDSLDTETATIWYRDLDSDGYGDAEDQSLACEQPAGFVDNDLDCDDVRNGVNPDAEEGCDGVDTNCDGVLPEGEEDDDGDGQRGCDGDCDDAQETVYEGAPELCDGLDNDCSGAAQDGEADDDGDGYVECEVDSGGWGGQPITGGEDCDDEDADSFPGADEYCDGHDDDCDGDIDEVDSVDVSTWYADVDGDGYGDASSSEVACDQPSNTVSDDSDCDDTDAARNPGEIEVCDGVDNDCDGNTSEDGLVTFVDSNSAVSDLTSSFGTSTVSAVTLATDGELTFCDGTYYATVALEADVVLSGQSGVAADVVLTSDGSGSVLTVETDGVEVFIEAMTVSGGNGQQGASLNCDASATVALENVVLSDGVAVDGGAVYSEGCEVSIDDSELTGNEATVGGAIAVLDGNLTLSASTVHDNIAEYGGAIAVYGGYGDAAASMDGTQVYDNDSDYGTVWISGDGGNADFECIGTTTTSSGLSSNTDGYGAFLLADEGSGLTLDTCDTGSSTNSDDNSPGDVYTLLDNTLALDDDESLSCSDGVCELGTRTTAGTTNSSSGTSRSRGILVLADYNALVTSVGFYVGSSCAVDFYVLSSSSPSGPWQEESVSSLTSSPGWNDLSMSLQTGEGTYYAFMFAWQICSMTWYEDAASSDLGFGTYAGGAETSTYGGSMSPPTITSSSTAVTMRVDSSI